MTAALLQQHDRSPEPEAPSSHLLAPISPALLDPTRLYILSLLDEQRWCWIRCLREHLNLSDGVITRQVAALRAAGLIETTTGVHGRKWLRPTSFGTAQLNSHVTALARLVLTARAMGAATKQTQPDWWCKVTDSSSHVS
jgi:DNA-binding transcriptional ArsR family regulator